MLPIESISNTKIGLAERFSLWMSRNPDWGDFVSMCSHPELQSEINYDNPLFVVHPGFRNYYPEQRERTRHLEREYLEYLDSMQRTVRNAESAGRSVFVFTPAVFLRDTLELISWPRAAVFVPTLNDGSVALDDELLGQNWSEFEEAIAELVEKAEICGEYGDTGGCLSEIVKVFGRIEFTPIKGSIFYYYKRA